MEDNTNIHSFCDPYPVGELRPKFGNVDMSKKKKKIDWTRPYAEAIFTKKSEKTKRTGGALKSLGRIKYEINRLGKLGPASDVRIIDPASIDVSKYLK